MIPKSFKIFGQTIKVQLSKTLHKEEQAVGLWLSNENKIKLQVSTKEYPVKEENIEQTFYHELVHCILDKTGHNDLSENEEFVERFSQALHQVLKTLK